MHKYESTQIPYCVLGRCLTSQKPIQDGPVKWEEFKMSYAMAEFLGINGEAIEFEWNIFQGIPSLEILRRIQDDLSKKKIEPEQFTDRIIFMPMFNDIEWSRRNIEEACTSKSQTIKLYAKRFSRGHWTFAGPGDERKWYGTRDYKPEGKWNSIGSQMVQKFKETGHPLFTSVSALSRGILRRLKGKIPYT